MILVSNLRSSLCFQVGIVGLLDGRVRRRRLPAHFWSLQGNHQPLLEAGTAPIWVEALGPTRAARGRSG
jgi:hypothetical protein